MRILHVAPTLSAGGAETFVAQLAIAQKFAGHGVEVLLVGGVRDARGEALRQALASNDVPCHGTISRSARSLGNWFRLAYRVAVGNYDVVHAHLFSVELLLASILPLIRMASRRYPAAVRTLHNSDIFGSRSKVITRALATVFDWNFACGPQVAENYASLFGRARLSVVENGVCVNESVGPNHRVTMRKSLNLPPDAFVVLCIGAFRGVDLGTSQKAQDVGLRAFDAAFANDPKAHLILIGDGELREAAEVLAAQLNCRSQIHFIGKVPSSEPFLLGADILLMPSRYEGLPIAALEAGCLGIPVVCSDIEELRQCGGTYGWRFASKNDVGAFAAELNQARSNLVALSAAAMSFSPAFRERYGIERCADAYLQVLHGLVRGMPHMREQRS